MANFKAGYRRFGRLSNEGCSVLLELLQNFMLFQELNGLLVLGYFKLLASLDTDG